jgi:hypothetical protein
LIAISSFKLKAAATGAACVVVGAAAGIVGASAAPTTKSSKPAAPALPQTRGAGRASRMHRDAGDLGPAVHASVVVLNKAGTGFITATEDSGTVQSVSGRQLTIKEAVGTVVYKAVTLTVPSGATISRNFSTAALGALKSGDRVRVVQSSEGTDVMAIDTSALPRRGAPGVPGGRGGPGGPGDPGGPGRPGGWGPGGRPGVQPQSGGAVSPSAPVPQTGA